MPPLPDCPVKPFDIDPYVRGQPWIAALRDTNKARRLLAREIGAGEPDQVDSTDGPAAHRDQVVFYPRLDTAILSPWLAERVRRRLDDKDDEYQDAFSSVEEGGLVFAAAQAPAPAGPDSGSTWALRETGVLDCRLRGQGVRVAVLDSGVDFVGDLYHTDLHGRRITMRSFVPGRTPWDDCGHGTHNLGIACGPDSRPDEGPRYGIASAAEIYVGKVLVHPAHSATLKFSDRIAGLAKWVIDGIDWAIENQCRVVCLSLSSTTSSWAGAYEQIARKALSHGTVLIAAAGNDEKLPPLDPVEMPAMCESVLAVGAVMRKQDGTLEILPQSMEGTKTRTGREINLVGPGHEIHSAFRSCDLSHIEKSGTSAAAAHVAGIAALYAQPHEHGGPGLSGVELWQALEANAKWLWPEEGSKPEGDRYHARYGRGLVQAPK